MSSTSRIDVATPGRLDHCGFWQTLPTLHGGIGWSAWHNRVHHWSGTERFQSLKRSGTRGWRAWGKESNLNPETRA